MITASKKEGARFSLRRRRRRHDTVNCYFSADIIWPVTVCFTSSLVTASDQNENKAGLIQPKIDTFWPFNLTYGLSFKHVKIIMNNSRNKRHILQLQHLKYQAQI